MKQDIVTHLVLSATWCLCARSFPTNSQDTKNLTNTKLSFILNFNAVHKKDSMSRLIDGKLD